MTRRTKPIDLFPSRLQDDQPETVVVMPTLGGYGVTARRGDTVVAVGVPTGETAVERTVRLHESIHARHDSIAEPLERAGVHPWAIQAVEDMRVQGPLWPQIGTVGRSVERDCLAAGLKELRAVTRNIGGDWHKAASTLPPELYNQALTAAARDYTILLRVGHAAGAFPHMTSSQFSRAWRLLPESLRAALENIRTQVQYANFVDAGKMMDLLMVDPAHEEVKRRADERAKRESEMATKATASDAERDAELDHELAKILGFTPDTRWATEYAPSLSSVPTEAGGEVVVGMMKIVDLNPKVEPTKLAQGRKRRPAQSGMKLRLSRLSNALATGRAFGLFTRKRRTPDVVGAVLFDASGSMHLTMELMLQLIELAPGAVIAYYSGKYDREPPADATFAGILHIVARDGRLWKPRKGEALPRAGGGNDVDFEALSWLLRQKGPRVFVTDKQFCGGVAGQQAAAIVLCDRSEASGAVTVIRDAAAALEEFRTQAKRLKGAGR